MAEIQEIEVAKLIPNPLNVKKHPKEQINDLAIQIQQEPGFTNPIIIDEDFMIWVGHGRLEAVKSLGWDKVPCITIHNMLEAEKVSYETTIEVE
jgi:ParB-like chromosome segregation protein Spo0J